MNNTITETENTLEGINSRRTEAEQVSELEGRMVEITTKEQSKEKINKTNSGLSQRPLGNN